ncbi:unnamed protein product [Rhizoctonia solani]|uniref:Uncharacterized protein n=1 Tax=Rhizoctonia solani TaxID=456999 RepID=A0A8H3DLY3_9AGAM|nr:unnamed protein product [Rhizoctonia solani]
MTTPPTLNDLHRLPGASTYRIANATILALRKALKLQSFELDFTHWGPKNALYTWYNSLQTPQLHTVHLRKERAAPFYHEFILFRLKDNTYWRIDRRQRQDEPTPINCIQDVGVPAFDTIEQVTGMGSFLGLDPLLAAASDCMIELEFKAGIEVDVGLVLRICRAIKEHPNANVYTLQRYNCFFFAQTLLMCIACGASNWSGWKEPSAGPWKSPNAPLGETWTDIDNASVLAGFSWNPTDNFNHDWVELSKQSNVVVHASPLLMHADHCNYCLKSQERGRQRSLSAEINRLKQELIEYWDKTYRQLLDDAYRMNHLKFVESGVWGIIKANTAEEDCKAMFPEKLDRIRAEWDVYYQARLAELLGTVGEILSPTKACEAWYEDPDEWGLEWNCKGGGPVKPAKEKWERDVESFIKSEFISLKARLEARASRLYYLTNAVVHEAAMRARMESFEQAMIIKLRGLDEHEFLKPMEAGTDPSGKLLPDQITVVSKQTKKTFKTELTKVTKRAAKIRNRVRHLFKSSPQLESVGVMEMERRIGLFLRRHGDNVQTYKSVLKCTSAEVQEDMKRRMDEIWARVTH